MSRLQSLPSGQRKNDSNDAAGSSVSPRKGGAGHCCVEATPGKSKVSGWQKDIVGNPQEPSEQSAAVAFAVFWHGWSSGPSGASCKSAAVSVLNCAGSWGIVQRQPRRVHRSQGCGPRQRCFAFIQFVQARDARGEALESWTVTWPWVARWRWSVSLSLVSNKNKGKQKKGKRKKKTQLIFTVEKTACHKRRNGSLYFENASAGGAASARGGEMTQSTGHNDIF